MLRKLPAGARSSGAFNVWCGNVEAESSRRLEELRLGDNFEVIDKKPLLDALNKAADFISRKIPLQPKQSLVLTKIKQFVVAHVFERLNGN